MDFSPLDQRDLPAAVEVVLAFRYGPDFAALTDQAQAVLAEAAAELSPARKIALTVELLWAARDQLDDASRQVGARLAQFAAVHGFWGLAVAGRGLRIAQALRADAGEVVEGFDEAHAPSVPADYRARVTAPPPMPVGLPPLGPVPDDA